MMWNQRAEPVASLEYINSPQDVIDMFDTISPLLQFFNQFLDRRRVKRVRQCRPRVVAKVLRCSIGLPVAWSTPPMPRAIQCVAILECRKSKRSANRNTKSSCEGRAHRLFTPRLAADGEIRRVRPTCGQC